MTYKDFCKMEDLSYDEICQHVSHFVGLSSDSFHEADNRMGAYYLVVVERFLNELKLRVVLTAI